MGTTGEYPWVKSYPRGIRQSPELTPTSVPQLFDDAVARWSDNVALDFMGRAITYRELGALVERAAAGFQALGVGPGVHVGLYLPTSPHYVISFFGVLKAGGVVVNYSPLDAEKALAHKIEDSETDLMVTVDLAALYPQMARLLATTRLSRLVVGTLCELAAAPEAVRAHLAASGQLCDIPDDERHVPFARLLATERALERHPLGRLDEAVAVLQYTGGTTGLPKGAMLTHANLSTACGQYWETLHAETRVLEAGRERLLVVLPMFHIYALTVNTLFGLRMGSTLVLHPRFEVDAVLRDLVAKKITVFSGVPTMFAALLRHPDIEKADLHALKYCGSGGAPLPVEVQQQFQRVTGCILVEGWGMTETSPVGTFTPVQGVRKPGSCGLPMPGVEMRFASIDEPGRWMPLGERGEICVRGPNLMRGYWKNPAATAAAMTADGFFRTGDVGYMDTDGYVFIVDRTKDMILCGGFNVYPRTVEEAIYEHPAVAEVTVIGIPDDYRGQAPKAFIKLKPEATPFTLAELKAFLKDRLGKHEMVQAIDIRDELPKTAVGKLSKKELYEEEERNRLARARGPSA